jgi:mono/diheme cytochrome c family protein
MRPWLGALALLGLTAGCQAPSPPSGEQPLDAAFFDEGLTRRQSEGRRVFLQRCATCHGDEGRGDGQNAYSIEIPPPDLTETLASLPQEERRRIVIGGTVSVERSPLCPPWGRSLDAREIETVLAYLEALEQPGS